MKAWRPTEFIRKKLAEPFLSGKPPPKKWFGTDGKKLWIKFDAIKFQRRGIGPNERDRVLLLNGKQAVIELDVTDKMDEVFPGSSLTIEGGGMSGQCIVKVSSN